LSSKSSIIARILNAAVKPNQEVSFVPATVIRPGFRTLLVIVFANLWAAGAPAQNELTEIPDPDPVAEQAAMTVDSLASVNLFAADPDEF
jgi:hypothetical protein